MVEAPAGALVDPLESPVGDVLGAVATGPPGAAFTESFGRAGCAAAADVAASGADPAEFDGAAFAGADVGATELDPVD